MFLKCDPIALLSLSLLLMTCELTILSLFPPPSSSRHSYFKVAVHDPDDRLHWLPHQGYSCSMPALPWKLIAHESVSIHPQELCSYTANTLLDVSEEDTEQRSLRWNLRCIALSSIYAEEDADLRSPVI